MNCRPGAVPYRFTSPHRSSVRLLYSGTLGSPTILNRWSVKRRRSRKSTFGFQGHFPRSASLDLWVSLFAALAAATTTKRPEPVLNVVSDPFPDPSAWFLDKDIPLATLDPSLRHTLVIDFYRSRQVILYGNCWYWQRTVRPGSGLQLCSHSHVEEMKCRPREIHGVRLYHPSNYNCRGIQWPWRDHLLRS